MDNISFRAQIIAALFIPRNTLVFDNFVQRLIDIQNETLEEAAQLAEDIDSGKYTATKTVAEAIRETKVR
jgi:hypothetical protein